jgi:hypothetical protein
MFADVNWAEFGFGFGCALVLQLPTLAAAVLSAWNSWQNGKAFAEHEPKCRADKEEILRRIDQTVGKPGQPTGSGSSGGTSSPEDPKCFRERFDWGEVVG